jgi:hypothetical protein
MGEGVAVLALFTKLISNGMYGSINRELTRFQFASTFLILSMSRAEK